MPGHFFFFPILDSRDGMSCHLCEHVFRVGVFGLGVGFLNCLFFISFFFFCFGWRAGGGGGCGEEGDGHFGERILLARRARGEGLSTNPKPSMRPVLMAPKTAQKAARGPPKGPPHVASCILLCWLSAASNQRCSQKESPVHVQAHATTQVLDVKLSSSSWSLTALTRQR